MGTDCSQRHHQVDHPIHRLLRDEFRVRAKQMDLYPQSILYSIKKFHHPCRVGALGWFGAFAVLHSLSFRDEAPLWGASKDTDVARP